MTAIIPPEEMARINRQANALSRQYIALMDKCMAEASEEFRQIWAKRRIKHLEAINQ